MASPLSGFSCEETDGGARRFPLQVTLALPFRTPRFACAETTSGRHPSPAAVMPGQSRLRSLRRTLFCVPKYINVLDTTPGGEEGSSNLPFGTSLGGAGKLWVGGFGDRPRSYHVPGTILSAAVL